MIVKSRWFRPLLLDARTPRKSTSTMADIGIIAPSELPDDFPLQQAAE
jgi:hypothetical protein